MSLLGKQTNVTPHDYFFLLANVSTLTADGIRAKTISTGTLTAGTANIQTVNTDFISTNYLLAQSISSQNTETNYAEISTIFCLNGLISSFKTNNVILDGNTLDTGGAGFGAVLLLNGLPIATGTSSLSSIQDWSFFPSLSTLQMGTYDIKDAGNITCQNIFNALNVQTDTLSALTSFTSPAGTVTNLRATNFSTVNSVNSNVVGRNISSISLQSQVGIFGGVSSLGVSTGSINGQPFISGSNWWSYPAGGTVSMNGNTLNGGSNFAITTSNLTITASNSFSNLCDDFTVIADEGANVGSVANVNLTAQNGTYGAVNITANGGFNNGINGVVNVTANGAQLSGVGQGGSVNITANTPLGFSNLTSKISLSASGINSYAGAIPPIASLAGYNYIYGTGGVNITAGIPSIFPNVPFTTFLYGTAGVTVGASLYAPSIYPYWDGTATPPDLEIAGRYIIPNLAQVYVTLSNVKYLDMDFFALIRQVKGINFCNGYSNNYISNADSIQGSNSISGYATISGTTVGGTTGNFVTLNGTNITGSNSIVSPSITASNLLSTTNLRVSSINGFNMDQLVNSGAVATNRFSTLFTSTFAFSTATSVGSNTLFNYPIVLDYDTAGNTTTAGVAIAVQGHNFSAGAVVNRIEMGARADGRNYITSVWPGQNLEDLYIDATDVTFNDGTISTIINSDPYSMKASNPIQVQNRAVLSGSNLNVSTINISTVNNYPYPWTSTLGGVVSTFTVDGTTATTPQLLGQIYFPNAGDFFLSQKVAFTKVTGGAAQDCHGILLLDSGALPTFPGGAFGMGGLPYINENGASTFTTVVTNIQVAAPGNKQIFYFDSTGNNYIASLITDLPVLHFNPGPPV